MSGMIGYYVHHVGQGHLHSALAVAQHLTGPVTVLSSLPRPAAWIQDWLVLPRDDDGERSEDPTAGGVLHWVPRHSRGLQSRMAVLAAWFAEHDPAVLVSDVSVEVIALARLFGIPAVTFALPGTRDDPAHQLGYDLADAIIAAWPLLDPQMCVGLERHVEKVHHVGGLSRFDGRRLEPASTRNGRTVLALGGAGGPSIGRRAPDTTEWHWTVRGPGHWVSDPWPDLCRADVVVTHCGLGALADVAAARRPAVLIPEDRPHDEQRRTARAVAAASLALVLDHEPTAAQWPAILAEAARRDGTHWSAWSPGDSAKRAAQVIASVAAA